MSLRKLPGDIESSVERALAEDIGTGDLTADLVEPGLVARAEITIKEDATLCGSAWVNEVFRQLDPLVSIHWQASDGESISRGSVVCTLSGPARVLLSGERTAINFLQTLSATATATRRFVDEIAGTKAKILDTRKTIPGHRAAQKYAVLCGGGCNHRHGLFDAVLIKENHIAASESLTATIKRARAQSPSVLIEVEVETLEQVVEALATEADRLLLDDFSISDIRRAVELRDQHDAPGKELEASGGITLTNVRAVAETGVDWISVGSITKDIRAIDYSMRII